MNPIIRQGDVLIIPCDSSGAGCKLDHLTLAEGEVTGHSHRISNGEAELFERDRVGKSWHSSRSICSPNSIDSFLTKLVK